MDRLGEMKDEYENRLLSRLIPHVSSLIPYWFIISVEKLYLLFPEHFSEIPVYLEALRLESLYVGLSNQVKGYHACVSVTSVGTISDSGFAKDTKIDMLNDKCGFPFINAFRKFSGYILRLRASVIVSGPELDRKLGSFVASVFCGSGVDLVEFLEVVVLG